jgi:mycothiol synthase
LFKEKTMQIMIRVSTADDDASVLALHHLVSPDERMTLEEVRLQEHFRDPRCRFERWVVEQEGRIVAVGGYDQDSLRYHPRTFVIDGMVHPSYQRQGIGYALYTQVVEALRPFDPLCLRIRIRVEMKPGIHFLLARGFREGRRLWESYLDLTRVTPLCDTSYEEWRQAQGLVIHSFKELEADPAHSRKLFQLTSELSQDVPLPEPRSTLSYEDFVTYKLQHPSILPEGCFIAQDHDEYIGLTELKTTAKKTILATGLTAVKSSYRKRGIAHMLKQRCLAYAKAHGYTAIQTRNDTRNLPILTLNEEVGFVKRYLWLELERRGIE